MLEKIADLADRRGEALLAVVRFVQLHPEFEDDPDLARARVQLLPPVPRVSR